MKSSLSLRPKKRETSVKHSDAVQAEAFGPDRSVKERDEGSKTTVRTGKKKNLHQPFKSFLGIWLLCSSKLQFLSGFLGCGSGQSLEGQTFCEPTDFTVNKLGRNRSQIYHLPVT